MKLKSWVQNLFKPKFYLRLQLYFMLGSPRQSVSRSVMSSESYMPLPFARRGVAILFCLGLFLAISMSAFAQTNYAANGTEYSIIGSLPGDQLFPDIALSPNGGFVVWQDNITDGSGWGISAMQLDGTLSGSGSIFRVNIQGTNNQEHARVALLKNGGAAFVWQGGVERVSQHIYSRFLKATNSAGVTKYVWVNATATNDTAVSTSTNTFQVNPAIATLTNGNVIVVWSSFNQANSTSMMDVYGQMLSTNGTRVGTNFLINQFTAYNQRNPAVAALKNGGFVVTWISEQERVVGVTNYTTTNPISGLVRPSCDVYARLYTISGTNAAPAGNEFVVNADSSPCSSPGVAVAADNSYMVTWCARDLWNSTNDLDVYERSFTNSLGGAVKVVNSYTYGDQYNPRISSIGNDYLILFTSLAQDGSFEGVYGQLLREGDVLSGSEFLVNTTTKGSQMQPAVASDGLGQFLAVWTSFTYGANMYDLFAQRYASSGSILEPMGAPFVWAPFALSGSVYQPQLVVSWAPVQGLSVASYKVFVNGGAAPMAEVASNQWIMTAANGLTTSSTNSFALEYVTSDGRTSPMSPSGWGATWNGLNWGGIPYEWMLEYYGNNMALWPSPTGPAVVGGPTLLQIFNSGGNPTNSATWLQTALRKTQQGMFLNWNTQPGMTYQVQVTTNFTSWSNLGVPRFESGTNDSVYLGNGTSGYYRVQLLWQ